VKRFISGNVVSRKGSQVFVMVATKVFEWKRSFVTRASGRTANPWPSQEAQFSVIVLAAKALDVAVVSGQDIFRCFGVMCLTLPIVVRISRTCV
jgi:hypothetical protein